MLDLPPCVEQAAEVYQLPVEIIQAIHTIEGGRRGQMVGPNRNGTYDMGPMQINTIWLPELAKHGISKHDVLNDTCTNIAIGAWIYRQELNKFRDYELAAAAYNAGPSNIGAGRKYARKVMSVFRRLLSRREAAREPVE